MEELTPSRQELRAILADPASTQRQIIKAKLVLLRRVANGGDKVRQVCEQYHLTLEQTTELLSSQQKSMGQIEAKAAEEVQRLERLLEAAQD